MCRRVPRFMDALALSCVVAGFLVTLGKSEASDALFLQASHSCY